MCLNNLETVDAERIQAFKTFALFKGQLYSAFNGAYTRGWDDDYTDAIPYKINQENNYVKVMTDIEINGFYSFAHKESAENITIDDNSNGDNYWNLRKDLVQFVVFPVTIYGEIHTEIKLFSLDMKDTFPKN